MAFTDLRRHGATVYGSTGCPGTVGDHFFTLYNGFTNYGAVKPKQ
jgi:hypothetical protein